MKRFISKAATAIVFLTAAIHGAICSSAATYTSDYDVDGNGKIEVADIVTLNHLLAEDTQFFTTNEIAVFDLNGDGMTTVEDSLCLINYMMDNELLPSTTTTTDSTTTNITTTSTTSTSPTQTTTTDTTTVSVGTTTSTTNTTNTTTSTTSTSTTVTTTSTSATSDTTSTTENTVYFNLINEVLKEVEEKETLMPLQDIEGLYRGDGIFFFNLNDTLYAYTMYTANEEEAKNLASYSPYYNVDAIHIWKYTSTTAQAYRAIPDTTGKTFEWYGETRDYNLCQKVDEFDLRNIAQTSLGLYYTSGLDIERFDYNLNGSIDREDLLYAVYLYGDSIYTLKGTSVDATEYYDCLLYGCLSDLELDNIIINWDPPKGTFLEYSYICPVGGEPTCCWWSSVGVYQILPDSFYDILYEDYGEPFEDGGDYIMYNREDWWTTSDYYNVTIVVVFQVDDDGNYVLERHPASDTLDSLQEN